MVCVSTSATLLDSVLLRAGPSITSQFKQQSYSIHPIILSGGFTSAQKILFIPWKLVVESPNALQVQKVKNKIIYKKNNSNSISYNSHYQI
jgi:hypothetical protein